MGCFDLPILFPESYELRLNKNITKMKKLTMFLALAALLSTGCSSDDELVPQLDGKGAVVLNFATSGDVVQSATRAPEDDDNYELPEGLVPEKEEFTLKVTGEYEGDAGETKGVKTKC